MGVEVRTGAKVTEATAEGLKLADGSFIASGLIVDRRRQGASRVARARRAGAQSHHPTRRDPDTIDHPRSQYFHDRRLRSLSTPRRSRSSTAAGASGAPLLPFKYRDFGSLVSLGRWSTFGNLMGLARGHGLFVERFFAQVMYSSLRVMHKRALHGTASTLFGVLGRVLTLRTRPRVKLHRTSMRSGIDIAFRLREPTTRRSRTGVAARGIGGAARRLTCPKGLEDMAGYQ